MYPVTVISLNKNGKDQNSPEKQNKKKKKTACIQFLMTKYEARSCSKIVMAIMAISLALKVSNLGFYAGL